MDQDDTLSYEDAHAQASDPLFNKAQGGLISLAQGGRIGLAKGDWSPGVAAEERAAISDAAAATMYGSGKPGMISTPEQQADMVRRRTPPGSTGDHRLEARVMDLHQ